MSLRLASWCTIHQKVLGRCSTFNTTVDQCNWMAENRQGFHASIFANDPSGSYYVREPRFNDYKGITFLNSGGPKKKLKWRTLPDNITMETLHPEKTHIPYDLLWTADITYSALFNFCLKRRNGAWFFPMDIPVVAGLDEDLDEIGIPQYDKDTDLGRFMALSGLCLAEHAFIITDQQRADVQSVAQEFLTSAKARNLMDKLQVHRSPCKMDHIEKRFDEYKAKREARKDGPLVVFHQGTFEAKRHLPEICKSLDKLAVTRKGMFKFLKTTQLSSGSLPTNTIPTELRLDVGRDEFHNMLGDGDVVLITSDRNCVGVGYAECVMSGMIPIYLNRRWSRERFPLAYPYRMDSIKDHLGPLLDFIRRNRNEAEAWAAKARNHWAKWDVRNATPKFYDYLHQIAIDNRKKCVPELFKFPSGWCIEKAIEKLPKKFIGHHALMLRAEEVAKEGKVSLQKWPATALRWMLLERGYQDHGGATPMYVKE